MQVTPRPMLFAAAFIASLAAGPGIAGGQATATYDIVIANGRVIDPESNLDATRWVGINGSKITAISATPLQGKRTIDAKGLVVAPGFIDLHAHGQDDENYRIFALDGVTTALELEVGTEDVPGFYAARQGKALINYGASASHIRARMKVFNDPSTGLLPSGAGGREVATDAQIATIKAMVETGLAAGGLGVGMGLQYTPAASKYEVLETFRAAAAYHAPVFVHTRGFNTTDPGSSVESFMEVIAASAISGAPLHIVHLNSMSLSSTPKTLQMVKDARERGLDVTTEAYPYIAGMTEIESPLLDQYANGPDSMFSRLMQVSTGQRLTRATFPAARKAGGMVILFLNTPEMEAMAMTSPLTAVASDGIITGGKGHPRAAGTFARTLGYYVRETKQLSMMDAICKMTLMPAQRLEKLAPVFRGKGRIRVGADADISVFDAATVIDKSTYQQPALPSVGFRYVLVNGVAVVDDGKVRDGTFPGRGERAPVTAVVTAAAQQSGKPTLQQLLDAELARFPGNAGIWVKHLKLGEEAAVRADDSFNSASVIKLPVLALAMQMAERGELSLAERITINATDFRGGTGVFHYNDPGLQPTFHDVLLQMIITSDNTATDIAIGKVGGVEKVNDWLRQNNYADGLKLNMTTAELFAKYAALPQGANRNEKTNGDPTYWLGAMTPRATGRLLESFQRCNDGTATGSAFASQKTCADIIRILRGQQSGQLRLPHFLRVPIGHKTGDFPPAVANDVGIIFARSGPIVVSFFANSIEGPFAEAEDRIGRIAQIIVAYFDGTQ